MLPESVAGAPEHLARFQREAQVLASLNYPNIAYIHGLEESNHVRALVMELVEGPTLAERIEGLKAGGGGLPLDEALAVAKQIADALEAVPAQRRFGISPDGQRFLMNIPLQGGRMDPVTVSANWQSILKGK